MSKLLKYYDHVADRLCALAGDKYVHFIAGAAIAQLVMAAACALSLPALIGFMFAFTVSVLAGFAKELCDALRKKPFEVADWIATIAGGLCGAFLALLIILAA